jgi:hypothetical protein
MNDIPELWKLIANHESELIFIYGEEKAISWYYQTQLENFSQMS